MKSGIRLKSEQANQKLGALAGTRESPASLPADNQSYHLQEIETFPICLEALEDRETVHPRASKTQNSSIGWLSEVVAAWPSHRLGVIESGVTATTGLQSGTRHSIFGNAGHFAAETAEATRSRGIEACEEALASIN